MAAVAKAVSLGGELAGPGIFISTHSAGPVVAICDICARGGLRFPSLRPEIAAAIAEFLPEHSVAANPLDMFAFAWMDTSLYLRATDLALAQDDIHCAVAVFVTGGGGRPPRPAPG
jgi:acyl-CoA synthetase (NDP forming)